MIEWPEICPYTNDEQQHLATWCFNLSDRMLKKIEFIPGENMNKSEWLHSRNIAVETARHVCGDDSTKQSWLILNIGKIMGLGCSDIQEIYCYLTAPAWVIVAAARQVDEPDWNPQMEEDGS